VKATPAPVRLLVANHVSWLDILAIASLAPAISSPSRRCGLARHRLARLARPGTVSKTFERALLLRSDRLRAAARAPHVVIFPEGTTSDGSSVMPFRPGLLQAAVDTATGAPVASPTAATREPVRRRRVIDA